MLTRVVSDNRGSKQIEVQVMDTIGAQLIRFTLDEIDRDELPEKLKSYIKVNLDKIRDGKWNYTGRYTK